MAGKVHISDREGTQPQAVADLRTRRTTAAEAAARSTVSTTSSTVLSSGPWYGSAHTPRCDTGRSSSGGSLPHNAGLLISLCCCMSTHIDCRSHVSVHYTLCVYTTLHIAACRLAEWSRT